MDELLDIIQEIQQEVKEIALKFEASLFSHFPTGSLSHFPESFQTSGRRGYNHTDIFFPHPPFFYWHCRFKSLYLMWNIILLLTMRTNYGRQNSKIKTMDALDRFFLTILFTMGIYCVFTIPHLLLIIFGWGIAYPLWLCIVLGIISALLSPFVVKRFAQ